MATLAVLPDGLSRSEFISRATYMGTINRDYNGQPAGTSVYSAIIGTGSATYIVTKWYEGTYASIATERNSPVVYMSSNCVIRNVIGTYDAQSSYVASRHDYNFPPYYVTFVTGLINSAETPSYDAVNYVSSDAFSSYAPAMAGAFDMISISNVSPPSSSSPITYRLTNCSAPDAPDSAISGETVTVPFVFNTGYGFANSSDVYVTNNGVIVSSSYSNGTLVFTMP